MRQQGKECSIFMKNKVGKFVFIISAFIILVLFVYLPVGNNTWQILTSRGYVIPAESSVFTFVPTVMNEGSGEWWLYGEDGNFYYHFVGSPEIPYMKISRDHAKRCKGFDSKDYKTWCNKELKRRREP